MDDDPTSKVMRLMELINVEYDVAAGILETTEYDVSKAADIFLGGGNDPAPVRAGGSNLPNDVYDEEGVRAPIAEKTECLYESLNSAGSGGMDFGGGINYHPQPRNLGVTNHIVRNDPFRNFQQEQAGLPHAGGLSALFQPPVDILVSGPFERAKVMATEQRRWLLINLQKTNEFDSHRLNRDLWSDSAVKELVRSAFVFWQHDSDTEEGQKFYGTYHPRGLPVVCIVEPSTGMLMKQWHGDMLGRKHEMITHLTTFLDNNPIDKPKMRGPANGNGAGEGPAAKKQKPPVEAMTEDEQIAAAIAASLGGGGASAGGSSKRQSHYTVISDSDSDGDYEDCRSDDVESDTNGAAGAADAPPAAEAGKLMVVPDEPPAGPGVTQVRLRLPDGETISRRFHAKMPTAQLYGFLRTTTADADTRLFDAVMFPNTVIPDAPDATLESVGAVNTVVTMRYQ